MLAYTVGLTLTADITQMPSYINLVGQKYSRLTVLEQSTERHATGYIQWVCRCDCGTVCTVLGRRLKNGNTKSCGCRKLEASHENGKARKTHGMTNSPEYATWKSMRERCTVSIAENYPRYGGRGIIVCDEWMNSFEAFYRDMGPRPSSEHSIDRRENDGNYEPGNCRWATLEEQNNNRRSNKKFLIDGKLLTLTQIARKYQISVYTLRSRIYRDHLPIKTAIKRKASHRTAHLNGVHKRLHEWANELNIPYLKIYRHVMTVSNDLKELIAA